MRVHCYSVREIRPFCPWPQIGSKLPHITTRHRHTNSTAPTLQSLRSLGKQGILFPQIWRDMRSRKEDWPRFWLRWELSPGRGLMVWMPCWHQRKKQPGFLPACPDVRHKGKRNRGLKAVTGQILKNGVKFLITTHDSGCMLPVLWLALIWTTPWF